MPGAEPSRLEERPRDASPEGGAEAPDDGPQLREVVRVLGARLWTVAGTFALVVLVTAVATFAQTPVYRSTSLLLIEPRKPNVANVQEVYDPITAGMSLMDYYRTQYEILKSRRIVEPVARALGVAQREEYLDARDPVDAFTQNVVVEPVRDSRLVRVSVDSQDAGFATRAANAIVEQFVDENNQRTLGISDSGLQRLREMERSLRPKHEAAARALQAFKDEHNILTLDESQSIAVQQMKLLSEDLSKARAERARVAAEKRAVAAVIGRGQAAETIPDVARSRVIEELKLELAGVERDRDELSRRYGPDHPALVAAEARVTRMESRLRAEERAILATIENRVAAAEEHERELFEAVSKAEATVAELGRKAIRLNILRDESSTVNTSYQNVARRIEEIELAIATGSKANNLFVIDRALDPQRPVRPRKVLNLALGAALGLLLGVGLAFLLEHLDDTVKGKEDVEALLGYPVLGFLPRVEVEAVVAGAIELTALRDPRSRIAEAFRTIRTGLGFTLPAGRSNAIVVTSAAPGDGKTFTSVNLAFALAQMGRRVLLVDADLRRPRVGAIFGLADDGLGLSTSLVGEPAAALAAVRPNVAPGLDVLPAGPHPPNPAELLGSEAMGAFLERALAVYAWVILDAPPVTAVADAAILLTHAPHGIFVARAFSTLKDAALRAKEVLEQAPGRVRGIVLNTVDISASRGGGYYGYGGYHGYGEGPGANGASSGPGGATGANGANGSGVAEGASGGNYAGVPREGARREPARRA